jgi:cell wall-associated NlpC family hydrolase
MDFPILEVGKVKIYVNNILNILLIYNMLYFKNIMLVFAILTSSIPKPDVSGSTSPWHSEKVSIQSKEDKLRLVIITLAREMKGSKYRKAGKKPGGFDCSGLVQYIYGRMEMPMAASADAQSQQVKKIKAKNAKPGDLLFFGTKSRIQHVGIVTENEDDHFLMVHSSSTLGVIEEDILKSEYWMDRLQFAASLTAIQKKLKQGDKKENEK